MENSALSCALRTEPPHTPTSLFNDGRLRKPNNKLLFSLLDMPLQSTMKSYGGDKISQLT